MGWMVGQKPLEHQLTMFGVWLELHYAVFLMTPRSCSHLHDSEVSGDLFFFSLCVILRRNHLRNLGYRFLYQQEMILSFHKALTYCQVYICEKPWTSEYVTVSTVIMYGGFHGGYKQCHCSPCRRRWLVQDSLMQVSQTWGSSHETCWSPCFQPPATFETKRSEVHY